MGKPGWYWVQVDEHGDWECAEWNGETWGVTRTDYAWPEYMIKVVGPRIPTPDEQTPTPCPDGGKCYKKGDTCGDPICVEWHADLLAAAPKPESQP